MEITEIKSEQETKLQDKVTEEIGNSTIKIYKLVIDEIHPVEETYIKGPIIDGDSLSEKYTFSSGIM